VEDIPEGVERTREANHDLPMLVFSSHADMPLAYAALNDEARGFIHAGMASDQILRAIRVALKGEIVAPGKLLECALADEPTVVNLNLLSPRQRKILELVVGGLSNAEIAGRIFLAESSVKQHPRAAYKLLGAKNRTEAAKLVRNGN
jgi:DNA-binding NarL/FixJ family response regulator